MSKNYSAYYNSPIGKIQITGTENSIITLSLIDDDSHSTQETNKYLELCRDQINEYFMGTRKEFELILNPEGTDFQQKVWNELLKIPFGKTESYQWQAKMVRDEQAIRAVASADGQNKIAIIIPCHRVIGSDGSLTGYAGGLWRKKWLLDHERKFYNGEKQLDLF